MSEIGTKGSRWGGRRKRLEWVREGECMICTSHSGDYPKVFFKGKLTRWFRVICERFHGPRPSLRHGVLHSCDKTKCINPRHLRWGTTRENTNDKLERSRTSKGTDRPSAKLCDLYVREIRASDLPVKELAKEYGVVPGKIRRIKKGTAWGHVI